MAYRPISTPWQCNYFAPVFEKPKGLPPPPAPLFLPSELHWFILYKYYNNNFIVTSGNRTTGSWCNSLVGQAHPSESCQVLTLTLWIPGQTLTVATNTANFIQNPSILRRLVYSPFTWWPHGSLMWAHWASNTELSTPQTLQPWWISEKLLYHWVSKKL